MNSYRIQIRSEGKYYDGIIKANNDATPLSSRGSIISLDQFLFISYIDEIRSKYEE